MRMPAHFRLLRKFTSDQNGGIAVLAAIFMVVIIGAAALGVDIGKAFTDRRKAQGTVDLAAIAAVNDLPNAALAAAATVTQNKYPSDTPVKVELGVYTPDSSVAPADRFKPAGKDTANAARVTMQASTALMFGRALTGRESFQITTRGIATRAAFASFAIGSRLLKVDGGLANQLLGGLLGTNLSLSVMDYQALIDAQVDLFDFMNATASRLHITGVNYNALLESNVKITDILAALTDTEKKARGTNSDAARALADISQSIHGANEKIPFSSVIDVGPYENLGIGQKPKVTVTASAFDILSATAQLANGQSQVNLKLNVNVPGIAGASLALAVGERPKGTSWMTVGAYGARVHTAQTRLLLTTQLIGAPPASLVNLPVYVEIASGTATLTNVKCGFPDVSTSSVTLGVQPGVIDAWIGNVSGQEFRNFRSPPNPGPAALVDLKLLKVNGRAHVAVDNLSPTPVTFTNAEINKRVTKTVGTKNFTASLLSKLIGDLQLDVTTMGASLQVPLAGNSQVAGILANAMSPVDQLLSGLLTTLGIGLGQADVWVQGIRCDGAVLVN